MSLTPEEQERKAENQKRNLLNQTLPVMTGQIKEVLKHEGVIKQ